MEQVGTSRGLSDMLNYGAALDSPAGWDAWPENLPLLVYGGEEDAVCDTKVGKRFVVNVKAKDKTFRAFEVSRVGKVRADGAGDVSRDPQ